MESSTPITVVVPTRNEGRQIAECVAQLAWAAEVIVVDGGSTEETRELARGAGARVLELPGPTIAHQRNAGIAAASHEWVLAIDADERVSPELAEELTGTVANPVHEAYAVRRCNVFLGKIMRHAGWGHDWVVRLFRRDRRFLERKVHEALEPVADVGPLAAPLEHHPYRDLAHYFEKLDRYSAWGADELVAEGRRPRIGDLLLRPPARFVRMYVLELGVLDGWHGAVLCGLAA